MAAQDPNASTESNGSALVATCAALLAVTWIAVLLRAYVRAIMLRAFSWDDWLILPAQAVFTISCIFNFIGVHYGVGRHDKSLDQHDEIQALKYQALAAATYILDMMFVKLSIGIFLLRLASLKRYRYTIYVSLVIITIWSLASFFWDMFQCSPVAAQWDYTILQNNPHAHCVTAQQVVNGAYALSVLNVVSDWLYALLPIPMVWKVKMTKQAKLTVMLVLSLGIFASVATLIRLAFLEDLTDTTDILFAATDAMVWTLVEPGVAITASCLVTIRPLLRAWKITGFQSTENSKRTGGPSGYAHQPASRSNPRSNAVPGFGSREVTLVDMELGHSKHRSLGSTPSEDTGAFSTKSGGLRDPRMSRLFQTTERVIELDEHQRGPDRNPFRQGLGQRAEARSEVFVIHGARSTETIDRGVREGAWLSVETSPSPSVSSVDMVGLEPVHGR